MSNIADKLAKSVRNAKESQSDANIAAEKNLALDSVVNEDKSKPTAPKKKIRLESEKPLPPLPPSRRVWPD